MDWVHCNSCHAIATQCNNKTFNLTSCGHIYCNSCTKSGNIKKCLVCGNNYTMIQLNSEIKSEIKDYFKTPEDILKRAIEIIMFQSGHQKQMYSYFKNVGVKYMSAKQEIMKLNGIIKKQEKEIKELRHQNNLMKQKLQKTIMQSNYNNLNVKSQSKIQSVSHSARQTPTPTIISSQTKISPLPFSNLPQSQAGHWLTPKHLTLHKPTPPSSGSSGGNNSTVSISPMSTPNFLNAYRSMSQYSSLSNTPASKPGTPESPISISEKSKYENIHSPLCRNNISGIPLQSTNKMLHKLNLNIHQPRGK
ncbi:hypothetical protein L9F63_014536 [Diploptera punctata]|uniref:RING-type domain-containing protein n=1 Tax=Diploptera punctata TaxID=6984 RepID=A0AAD8ELA9_DIPPU|nr:hypothetical protein L9F63_014536 [Diploptera punctata]